MTTPAIDPMELPYDDFEAWLEGKVRAREFDSSANTPLPRGTPVAWIEKRHGVSIGASPVHRVYDEGRTYCLMPVPPDDRRMPEATAVAALAEGNRLCQHCVKLHRADATFKAQVAYSMPAPANRDAAFGTASGSVTSHG